MLFRVRHKLRYAYAAPATLDSQAMRLRPREDGSQRVMDHHLTVKPVPSLLSGCTDEFGNVEARAWFLGETPQLEVEVESTVETLRINPFDFLIDGEWMALPWGEKLVKVRPTLAPYLCGERHPALVNLSANIRQQAGGEILPFLLRLNRWIQENLAYESRTEGVPRSPLETLELRKGACRDLAVLFMALARCEGIPARFVSGYHEGDPESRVKELHSWAEVFLPGGGWRGFDPSVGLVVADRHVALAAAPEPAGAAALSGYFSSPKPGSKLETEVMFY